nr:MAG TPA: hypothetical protein [Caudoviricetes sp.]
MQRKSKRFFLHYFFIRRTAEGGKSIERIQLFDAGTAARD